MPHSPDHFHKLSFSDLIPSSHLFCFLLAPTSTCNCNYQWTQQPQRAKLTQTFSRPFHSSSSKLACHKKETTQHILFFFRPSNYSQCRMPNVRSQRAELRTKGRSTKVRFFFSFYYLLVSVAKSDKRNVYG